jgi:CheY-like chemotaxis protein
MASLKQIGFVTSNKVLAQSLAVLAEKSPDLEFRIHPLLNLHQAVLDTEILKIDTAVVDVIAGTPQEAEAVLEICERLRQTVPNCRILLLVPQVNKEARGMATRAVKNKTADDYVFYDVSLDYLLAKLLVL